MKLRRALTGIVAMAALVVPAAADAAAPPASPSAPALLSRVTRVSDQLALLSKDSGPLGPLQRLAVSELRFTNRDGYRFAVVAYGQTVALSVSNGHRRQHGAGIRRSSTTTYLAHGEVTPTSIGASFGDRGRIAVHFRPTGQAIRATKRAGCARSGDGVIARLGLFVGRLSFRGEGGYTSAGVHRARGGSIDFEALLDCLVGAAPSGRQALLPARAPSPFPALWGPSGVRGVASDAPGVRTNPSRGLEFTTLIASRKLPVARTIFGARVRDESRPLFVAVDLSVEGRLGIARYASARGPRSAFGFDGSLSSATVLPPAPFSGKGVFQHGVGSERSWTGSLTVSFLGAPRVPIVGAPFSTHLAQGW